MDYKNNLIYNTLELPPYLIRTAVKRHELLNGEDWEVAKIRYGQHKRQYALLVSKSNWGKASNRPIAIYFHGGAWTFGSPEQFLPAARLFLAAGYRVLMPSYRRLPSHDFGDMQTDLKQLLRALGDQLEGQNDGGVIAAVAGMSAGGHLAAILSWSTAFWAETNWLEGPKKSLFFGGVLDLDLMPFSPGLKLLRGSRESPIYHESNPAYWLNKSAGTPAAALVIHGTSDGMAPYGQAQQTFSKLQAMQPASHLYTIPNGTHLDACRWMYQEDAIGEAISAFLGSSIQANKRFRSTPSE